MPIIKVLCKVFTILVVVSIFSISGAGLARGSGLATQVSAGIESTCALLSNKTIKCWGGNTYGQLGDNTTTDSSAPVLVKLPTAVALPKFIEVSVGKLHACALLRNGHVACWGYNRYGQLGDASTSNSSNPVLVNSIVNAVSVSAGEGHSCALISDGTVKCWGNNSSGQLGDGTTTTSSTPVQVRSISNATAVSAGQGHSCALISDGTVKCWGDNLRGALGNGSTTDSSIPVAVNAVTNIAVLESGYENTFAVTSSGAIDAWGSDSLGALGDSVIGADQDNRVLVDGIFSAITVSGGYQHACAVLSDGTVKCWGDNFRGALGNGTITDSYTPVEVSGITDAVDISAGYFHSCAVTSIGEVECWGENADGELGDGTTADSSSPVTVVGIP